MNFIFSGQYQPNRNTQPSLNLNLLPFLQPTVNPQTYISPLSLLNQQLLLNSNHSMKRKLDLFPQTAKEPEKKVKASPEAMNLSQMPIMYPNLKEPQINHNLLLQALALQKTKESIPGVQIPMLPTLNTFTLQNLGNVVQENIVKQETQEFLQAQVSSFHQLFQAQSLAVTTVKEEPLSEIQQKDLNPRIQQNSNISHQPKEDKKPRAKTQPNKTDDLLQQLTKIGLKKDPNTSPLESKTPTETQKSSPKGSEKPIYDEESTEEELDAQSDAEEEPRDLYTPPYWIKIGKKGKGKPELRERAKGTKLPEEPKITDPLELLKSVKSGVEEILGFTDIDDTKVYGLLTRSEMDPKKFFVRLKRNIHYYKTNFKLNNGA